MSLVNDAGVTVILAAGDFPTPGGKAWQLLTMAERVICCDGAADSYRQQLGREPFAVVGDGDSLQGSFTTVVHIAEQETNDLTKAVRWCREQGWTQLIVLGACGRREDHTLGNIFCALKLGVEIVSDYGRFIPFEGRLELTLPVGTPLSVFAPNPATEMTSEGLVWPLHGVYFDTLARGTLNRVCAPRLVLTANHAVLVYVAHLN